MPTVVPYCADRHREPLARIYLDSRTRTFSWLDTTTYQLSDFERDTDGESILVLEDLAILGFSSVWESDRFLHHLYVEPSKIGNSLGSQLLDSTIQRFGLPMRLKCLSQNHRALRFYSSRGWKTIRESLGVDGYYFEMEVTDDA